MSLFSLQKPSSSLGKVALLIAPAVFANLFLLLLGQIIFAARPLVILDYFVVTGLGLFLPAALSSGLILLVFVADVAMSLSGSFHLSVKSLLAATKYIFLLSFNEEMRLASILLLLIACGLPLVSYQIFKTRNSINKVHCGIALAFIACFSFGADCVNGTNNIFFNGKKQSLFNVNISGSYAANGLLKAREAFFSGAQIAYSAAPVTSATETLFRDLDARPDAAGLDEENILLILVESLGVFHDPRILDGIAAPLESVDIKKRYAVRRGAVPSEGATTMAEFRELCRSRLDYGNVSAEDLIPCLPNRLSGAGYATVSVHGFGGGMFDRLRWYPWLGFQESLFAQELKERGFPPACGSTFKGACDDKIPELIVARLKSGERKTFMYWLTLNTHYPIPVRLFQDSDFDCGQFGVPAKATACSLVKGLAVLFDSIARLAANPDLPKTRIFIVGDHPPPYSMDPFQLCEPSLVPFFELAPHRD